MSAAIRLVLAGALASALLAAPATAARLLVSFTGTSDSQFSYADTDGVIQPLEAAGLLGSFVLDTNRLPANTGGGGGFDYSTDATPFLTNVTLSIGGIAPAFGGSLGVSNVLNGAFGPGGYVELLDGRTATDTTTRKATSIFRLYGDLARAALPADGAALPDLSGASGLLFDLSSSAQSFDELGNLVSSRTVFTSGSIGSISVTSISAVPEPATWATMTASFALVGAALRRRRRREPAAV